MIKKFQQAPTVVDCEKKTGQAIFMMSNEEQTNDAASPASVPPLCIYCSRYARPLGHTRSKMKEYAKYTSKPLHEWNESLSCDGSATCKMCASSAVTCIKVSDQIHVLVF